MKVNMRTKFFIILPVLALAIFTYSCNNPLGLGTKLDIDGPVVEFTLPSSRKAVPAQFAIEGTVTDYSGVDRLLIKVEANGTEFPKQWQYSKGKWEVSENSGANWAPYSNAVWKVDGTSVTWSIPIDLSISGVDPEDGEYTFSAQAWDTGGFTDDKSFKTLVLIFDRNPPKVQIVDPYIYTGFNAYENDPFKTLHDITDDSSERFEPAMIGKFLTRQFQLQWQIEDSHDVWSIDIRLYNYDVVIDNNHETPLPDNYIYYYHKNLPPPPEIPDPQNNLKPNGSVLIPSLTNPAETYEDGGVLKNPVTEKTTVKVVTICYDAAGNPNQEKTLGYFAYWPLADEPWIAFSEGIESSYANLEEDVFLVYPERSVRSTAFHAWGLKEVKYSLYKYDEEDGTLTGPLANHNNVSTQNTARNGVYSTVFSWEFIPPVYPGYYMLKAVPYNLDDKEGAQYSGLFKVQDVTFPDFPKPPSPSAIEPLYKFIADNSITISGTVSDAKAVVSLSMVWINPQSRNYAAMSQLSYFRDKDYDGWKEVLDDPNLADGSSVEEGYFDPDNKNRVWKIAFKHEGEDPDTHRQLFSYSQKVNLTSDMKIAMNGQPLSGQVFLFRLENIEGKCTIITYTPQGDVHAPEIWIDKVDIIKIGKTETCRPGVYAVIEKLQNGDKISIQGGWKENSTEYLAIENYLFSTMKFFINSKELVRGNSTISWTLTPSTGKVTTGNFVITGTLVSGGILNAESLKDALMVSAEVCDIGGNPVETAASWLIQSDNLRFLRVSSSNADQAYTTNDEIELFLEFSKPVRPKAPIANTYYLLLNNGGRAYYKANQNMENTHQYFIYTVGSASSENTGADFIDVGSLFVNSINLDNGSYPFTWLHTYDVGTEEIRITNDNNHDGIEKVPGREYYAYTLPKGANIQSLIAGKNISIDTIAPTVERIHTTTPTGWYSTGAEISISVEFNEFVKLGSTNPYLNLSVNGQTSTSSADIRVNNETITFKYVVKDGDNTQGAQLMVTGFGGSITDLAGTPLAANGISNMVLTGIILDAVPPSAPPTVRIYRDNSASNQIGISGASPVNLQNLYWDELLIRITNSGAATADNFVRFEYSADNGANWTLYSNSTTNIPLTTNQPYQVIARQYDGAGNYSESQPVSFTWDRGYLITRIDTTRNPGTYTKNPYRGNEDIPITVNFRKPVRFSSTPSITINVQSTTGGPNITLQPASGFTLNTLVSSVTFAYPIGDNDNSRDGQPLRVTINTPNGSVFDSSNTDVALFITNDPLQTTKPGDKDIYVLTRALNMNTLSFSGGTVNADNSYNTQLVLTFNNNISRGPGYNITITQSPTGYRLPAVLTEAQYNKYRHITGFDTYYTRGTNGYISGANAGADTSTKYILRFDVNPVSVTPNANAAAGSIAKIADEMRLAEAVTISVNAQAVNISGTTVTITLSGSNALQVPGAAYLISCPSGFVQDELSYPSGEINNQSITAGGVAKPFIRVNKTQDTITAQAGDLNTPRLAAAQPFQAQVRMDSRTPNSTILYRYTDSPTNENGRNYEEVLQTDRAAMPVSPNTGGTTYTSGNILTIGANDNYQGYEWYGRAVARTGTAGNYQYSADSEEKAYRTVVTFVTNNMPTGNTGDNLKSGDHIWIRGGDAISSSSVPGFPLTWDDDFTKLQSEGKRAGIKLMTKASGTSLNDSIWKWVTWEINTTAYINFYLGHEEEAAGTPSDTVLRQAWQYGPKLFASQRANWTANKEGYPVPPGTHRWLDSRDPQTDRGLMNFSGTLSARPTLTISSGLTMGNGWVTPP